MFVSAHISNSFGGTDGTQGSALCDGTLVGFDVRLTLYNSANGPVTILGYVSNRCRRDNGSLYNVTGGGGSSGDQGSTYCPAGYVGIGIKGRSSTKIDAISLICGNINDLTDTKTTTPAGGTGGTDFEYRCPYPSVATGINYRASSAWVISIQLICIGELSLSL